MSILLVVHREPLHDYLHALMSILLVVHRELASHVTTNSFWCLTDLHNKCFGEEAEALLRSACKTFSQFLGIRAEATTL